LPYSSPSCAHRLSCPSVARRRLGAAGLPGGMPQAHGLAGDAELAGDLSLANTDNEQLGAAQPAAPQPFRFLCRAANDV
jgi:hypothetical protein